MVDNPFWLAFGGAVIPCLLWLRFFYSRDRYDKEPKRLILKLFLVGAFPVGVIAGIVNATAQAFLDSLVGAAALTLVVVVVAPLGEETLKYLGTSRFSRRNPAFDEPVDGMIYGSTVGLGFAAAETVDYLTGAYLGVDALGEPAGCAGLSCLVVTAIVRGLGTALLHATATGISGYFLSRRVLGGRPRIVGVFGVLVAAAVHAGWNGSPFGLGPLAIALAVPVAIYWFLMRRALKASPHHGRQLMRVGSPWYPPEQV